MTSGRRRRCSTVLLSISTLPRLAIARSKSVAQAPRRSQRRARDSRRSSRRAKAIEALVAAAARLGIELLARAAAGAARRPRVLRAARRGCRRRRRPRCRRRSGAGAARDMRAGDRRERSPSRRHAEEPGSAKDDADPKNDNAQPREAPALDDVVVAAARAAIPADVWRGSQPAHERARPPRAEESPAPLSSPPGADGRCGARRGALREGRLCLIETLRAAAPWQPLRRAHAADDARLGRARARRRFSHHAFSRASRNHRHLRRRRFGLLRHAAPRRGEGRDRIAARRLLCAPR